MVDAASLAKLRTQFLADIDAAKDLIALDAVRIAAFGKTGAISAHLKSLGSMSPEQRATSGVEIHAAKDAITNAIATRKAALEAHALDAQLKAEHIDLTPPALAAPALEGRIHPVSQVTEELITIFAHLGFDVAEGPDIETAYYNFTALNIAPAHPARQMHDTFYFPAAPNQTEDEGLLLRTHTSPVQIHTMENGVPPFRFIAPGRTYRCDSDQTHTPMFHQVEGLVIDKDIHLGHLKWTLESFLARFFEVEELAIRLRPSYFPFTEPSMEVDMQCRRENGRIIVGEGDEWLEIGGSGMVHPRVLAHVGLDNGQWQGFAFGMGIDRLAMLKYGMPDLRAFFDSDLRWLKHYGFLPFDMPSLAYGLSHKSIARG